MKRQTLLLLLCAALYLPLLAQNQDSMYLREHYTKIERLIAMRDGAQLFTAIYVPKDIGEKRKYPILLKRTPYSCRPYGEEHFVASFQNMALAREGYIFVFQDVRGRWASGGVFEDVRPHNPSKVNYTDTDESSDTHDSVEWLINNIQNNNGKVGVYGISYPGFYSTMALLANHDAIKAVSPQAPVTDWFIGDDFHHNGAFMLMDAFDFYNDFGVPRPQPVKEPMKPALDTVLKDNYHFYLGLGALSNVKNRYFGDSIRFWNDLMAHPNYDDYWKARNIRPHLKGIKPAVLVVGGWFDAEDCFGALHTYEAIEAQNTQKLTSNRLVMGPWFHGAWGGRGDGAALGNVSFGGQQTSAFYQKLEMQFFNFYLKDKGSPSISEATIFETGSNEWRFYDTWPPKGLKSTDIFLKGEGKLDFGVPQAAVSGTGESESFDEYVSDPAHPVPYAANTFVGRTREYMTDDQRFVSCRPDVVTYSSEVLTQDMTLSGAIEANLFVSTTGTDADFVVKVIDVFPDDAPDFGDPKVPQAGYQMLVRGEVMRGRYRNSFETPEAFEPNKVTQVKFNMPDVAHTFKRGHRLMVQIQSSWFPLVDRNPQKFVNIYEAKDIDFQKATHRIYHDAQHPSTIRVMVLNK